jgi:hypothetical protein
MIHSLAPIAALSNQEAKGYVKVLKKSTSQVSTMRKVVECSTYRRDGQFNGAHVAGNPSPLRLVAEPTYWQGIGQECGRIGGNARDGL